MARTSDSKLRHQNLLVLGELLKVLRGKRRSHRRVKEAPVKRWRRGLGRGNQGGRDRGCVLQTEEEE